MFAPAQASLFDDILNLNFDHRRTMHEEVAHVGDK
jgi:hypothetical protein